VARRRSLLGAGLGLALAGAAAAQPTVQAPAGKSFKFEPKTQVDGEILQVVFGERALFRLDDGGKPVLDSVEKGQLAAAHPPGSATETFTPPGPGLIAAALDGSAEKQASVMKVWNRLDHAVEYKTIALVLHGQTLSPVAVPTCPIAAGGAHTEIWPAPVVAVGLSRFKPASKEALARCVGGAKPAAKSAPKKGK
jgi:hypothetical protein